MDALEALLTRRSIRKFQPDRTVPPGTVETLIRAAMAAPSARNLRPCEYLVVEDRRLLDALAQAHPHGRMLAQASLAVVLCADPDRQPLEGYWLQDLSAATENLLLAAHALGLGAVWLGVQPRPEREAALREILQVPEPFRIGMMVAIGYPAETKEGPDRYEPARVHRDRW
ncbi:nitroreductase family protein [Myxococcota bacterium]|nr:nitroreductase family protein [Myxococcota bacterium]